MTIVITLPHFFPGEAAMIVQLLQGQVDLVHIRKPEACAEETEQLITEIPPQYRNRLVLHDHHWLAAKYHLHGIHLNSRNPQPPPDWKGSLSRSCHSLEEVMVWKEKCSYVSLSPIFDSISKKGYRSAFTREELRRAHADGIIDNRVMALGGVTFNKLDEVTRMGFGGGMILGDAWKNTAVELDPVAMTVAGSDSSAGAGIQQDLKTMTALGVYAATVVTAVTSQNTTGITMVRAMDSDMVRSQMQAVLSDLNVRVIKIGMIPNAHIAHAIASTLAAYKSAHPCQIVYDPVMVSTSGRRLMDSGCIATVVDELFPVCSLITPNIPEAHCLADCIGSSYDATLMSRRFNTALLVKGGHADGNILSDMLYMPDGSRHCFQSERIASCNLHGTGCTLSSAISANIVKGFDMPTAIGKAKEFVSRAIENGRVARIGKGNGPLLPVPLV